MEADTELYGEIDNIDRGNQQISQPVATHAFITNGHQGFTDLRGTNIATSTAQAYMRG